MRLLTHSRSWCAVLVCAVPLLAAPGSASAAPEPVVKAFHSPGQHHFVVPKGVTRIHLTVVGAGGGGGGGNNDGPMSGGGGGGGGSGAVESCTVTVKAGDRFSMVVGYGGPGGARGSGKFHDGRPGSQGAVGKAPFIYVSLSGQGGLASAQYGLPGKGGGASGAGNGSGGAGGGTSDGKAVCKGSDHVHGPAVDGFRGEDGQTADRGEGGAGGWAPVSVPGCSISRGPGRDPVFAGTGGQGGAGAGRVGGAGGNGNTQQSSWDGARGQDGCVSLTYTL